MDHVRHFMDLFEGLQRAHGTYEIQESRSDKKKTGKAATLAKPVTEQLWRLHLEGKRSLGIIPINDESMVKFGAIDIDVYEGLSHAGLVKLIKSHDLPLIVCRSKSGGAHLYLFTEDWVPASLMQSKLKEIAAGLGYGKCEIFPKQVELIVERGDIGQWINMPYFDMNNSARYAVGDNGRQMSVEDFIAVALNKRVSEDDLESLGITVDEEKLEDGPPCLQYLITQGFPEGTRNDGLFNLGVYYFKSAPDEWERKVEQANQAFLIPPLTSEEVLGVQKSLRKKDFNYTCSKPPIVSHCNSAICRQRKFGVGNSGNMAVLTSLTKLDTKPPIWFVDVEGGGRLELTTEELHNQVKFQRKCFEAFHMMPNKVSGQAWENILTDLGKKTMIIEMPDDASPEGQLMEYLHAFCHGKARARTREEMLLGKPWYDEVDETTYFRIGDFMSYLERHHFREFKVNKIASILQTRGLTKKFFNLKGKGLNAWGYKANSTKSSLSIPDEVENGKPNY